MMGVIWVFTHVAKPHLFQYVEGTYSLHLHSDQIRTITLVHICTNSGTLKMKPVHSSEMSVWTNLDTWCRNPEDGCNL